MDDTRIDELLDAMTPEEQVSLLSGADFWTTAPIPRLGVPAIKVSDGPNGARGAVFKDGPGTACFPAGIALASTWDPPLVQEAGAALGTEARLKGARVLLAPTVNLQRTVYNGRNFECHSEDPWLASEMAVAYVRGVQSAGVAATIKHYVGNESEFERMSMSSDIDERTLREMYLLPFERAVKEAGVMAVMTGYNRVNGTFMADHARLVAEVLREEWGFDGLVMTDWYASHDTVAGVQAGCDLEMPGPARERGAKLVSALREGRVAPAAVRACARRVLRLAARVGCFKDPVVPAERDDDLPEHRSLIRRLGSAGAVLLRNEGDVLPLSLQAGQTVAVIGWAAIRPQIMGGGSATVNAHYRIAPLDALREACPDVRFVHVPGADLHRYIPVCASSMTLEFYGTADLSGPIVAEQTSPNGEVLWIGNVPAGVDPRSFSCRARLRYVAETSGLHAFSLASAGLSRATINGEPAIDAWSAWSRGETYFTYGCNEVVHRRQMQSGDVAEIVVEYSSDVPRVRESGVQLCALRVGAARELGDLEIDEAVAAARAADAVVVFAGLNAEWDCEGLDRQGIDLPHRQNELIARVGAANPRCVVVLQSGSPLQLPWLKDIPAVLQAWYPGQECGHAIADVLLGRAEPGGRLPQTWPEGLAETVAYGDSTAYPGVNGHVAYREGLVTGYRHHLAHAKPTLFAFGHGLSYTRFEWSGLHAQSAHPADDTGFGAACIVDVTVRNSGDRAGCDVVQIYLSTEDADESLPRPARWLAGFGKIHLTPGQQQTLRVSIPGRAFSSYDPSLQRWVHRPGRYALIAARSASDAVLGCTIVVEGGGLRRLHAASGRE
jgi:beta-glucosidase